MLRTGITHSQPQDQNSNGLSYRLGLSSKSYVILPWNFNVDEPLTETLEAIRAMPNIQFVMTWYVEKLAKYQRNNAPSNLKFTGFLELDDFNHLFSHAGVALVLTTRDGTQLSGMHEAMAFEIPAVISDLKTTRLLYKDAPIYVNHDPASIAEGVKSAFKTSDDLKAKIKKLRMETEKEFSEQILKLETLLYK